MPYPVRIAVVGVGNNLSAPAQGVRHYVGLDAQRVSADTLPGICRPVIGGIALHDIELVAAYDIDRHKIPDSGEWVLVTGASRGHRTGRGPRPRGDGPPSDPVGPYRRGNLDRDFHTVRACTPYVRRRLGPRSSGSPPARRTTPSRGAAPVTRTSHGAGAEPGGHLLLRQAPGNPAGRAAHDRDGRGGGDAVRAAHAGRDPGDPALLGALHLRHVPVLAR